MLEFKCFFFLFFFCLVLFFIILCCCFFFVFFFFNFFLISLLFSKQVPFNSLMMWKGKFVEIHTVLYEISVLTLNHIIDIILFNQALLSEYSR